jgi:hypothetical protein
VAADFKTNVSQLYPLPPALHLAVDAGAYTIPTVRTARCTHFTFHQSMGLVWQRCIC